MVTGSLTLDELKTKVLLHPMSFIERYPPRRVNNIYFDTNDLANYYDSLSGVSYRSKLRFRWYGQSFSDIEGVMELKEKKGMLISKILQKIDKKINLIDSNWAQIISVLENELVAPLNLDFCYACMPILINSYYRYYFETNDGSCRITLDSDLKVFDQRLYNRPNINFPISIDNRVILEIKSDEKSNCRLREIANYFPFRIAQNSKYTSGVTI